MQAFGLGCNPAMSNRNLKEGKRRGLRVPSAVLPTLITVAMVLAAVFLLDDGSRGVAVDERSLTMVGDTGSGAAGRATLAGMAAANPTLHVLLGDLSADGPGSEGAWCRLVRDQLSSPVQLVAGNDEDDSGEDGRIANFEHCLPDRMHSLGLYGREYYFDVGTLARVILISPDLTIEGEHFFYGEGNVNQRWLEAAIDGARGAKIPWVIVGMHKTCISVGEYSCDVYQDLFSILIKHRVDLVVSAHDHSYQRSAQLRAGTKACPVVMVDTFARGCVSDDGRDGQYRRGQGPVFVISGAGGQDLYDVHDDDPERPYFASVMGRNSEPRSGFLRIRLRKDRLEGEFVGTTPGTFTDRFTIDASESVSVASDQPA